VLPEIDAHRTWRFSIPATARFAPIGLGFRIAPLQARATDAAFASSGRTFTLTIAGGRQVRFTADEHAGLVMERADDGAIAPRRRTFLEIELYDAQTFPELGRMNGGAALEAAAVDIREYVANAMAALLDAWPEAIPDVVTVFRGVIALNSPNDHVYSASTDRAPFLMQLTVREHESRMLLAEMIVHEAAHIKLHLLSTLDPLIIDHGERRYTHPWRADLRPITGVLFGAHAFLNVLLLYEHAVRAGVEASLAEREARLRRSEVHEALSTLGKHARFTDAGNRLYAQMCRAAGFHG